MAWRYYYLLLLALASIGHSQGQDSGKCDEKTDVIFVVDRSGSVKPSDYNQMRKFLDEIGKALQVGVRSKAGEVIGQAGIVTFSEKGSTIITLKGSQTPGAFSQTVNDHSKLHGPLPGGRTKTHFGLDLADKELANKANGFREDDPDVVRMLIIITDGEQTRGGRGFVSVQDAVKPFFERDMDIYAIGVGLTKQRARDEISHMVETDENAIFAESYSDLIKSVKEFVRRFCPAPPICGTEKDDCHPTLGICTDTGPGTFECKCKVGYVGDGRTCRVPAICGTEKDDCHPTLATCEDTGPNEFECTCIEGYVGDGRTCIADKICGTEKDDCHQFATCTDTSPGEYKCTCNKGYTGNGKICEADEICGTEKDDCHQFATCTNTGPGKYKCTCNKGYSGNGKICKADIKLFKGPGGDRGEPGPPGQDGSPGSGGQVGQDGLEGKTGPKGYLGQDGNPGAYGAPGQPGPPGGLILSFAAGYLDRGRELGSLPKGPTQRVILKLGEANVGPRGRRGKTGSLGPSGQPGLKGTAGATAARGPHGVMGRRGPSGKDGNEGPAGSDGIIGRQGVFGGVGKPGEVGAEGALGPQGHTGWRGMEGRRGVQGRKGNVVTNILLY